MGACFRRGIVDEAVSVWEIALLKRAQGKKLTQQSVDIFITFIELLAEKPLRTTTEEAMLRHRRILENSPEAAQYLIHFLETEGCPHMLGKTLEAIEKRLYKSPPPYSTQV